MSYYYNQQQNTDVMNFMLFGSVWLRRHTNGSSGTDPSWYWVASRVNCDALNGSVGKLPFTWTMWLKGWWQSQWQPEAYCRRQKTYKAFWSDRYRQYLLLICFSFWKIKKIFFILCLAGKVTFTHLYHYMVFLTFLVLLVQERESKMTNWPCCQLESWSYLLFLSS